jgi:hypothetical protein
MPFNMMIGYDVYDLFTMKHFPLRQNVTFTTKIYCSQLYIFVHIIFDTTLCGAFICVNSCEVHILFTDKYLI